MSIYHPESERIFKKLLEIKDSLKGSAQFSLANLTITIESKDGLGGLIEEWFGVWASNQKFKIENPKKTGSSQEFPDYFLLSENTKGELTKHYLEIKTFDATASPNFDIANFQSYCSSLAKFPERIKADYLIFAYKVTHGGNLIISDIYLKKIWEITCASARWPLKTQTKRNVIYNIRPSSFQSANKKTKFPCFKKEDDFISALFSTEKQYLELNDSTPNHKAYLESIKKP